MKVVIFTLQYAPIVGGVPEVARLLAIGFARLGCSVRVVTPVSSSADESGLLGVTVVRSKSWRQWRRIAAGSDGIVVVGDSMRISTALLGIATPVVMTHQMQPRSGWVRRFLRSGYRHAVCSPYIGSFLPGAVVIGNPYDSDRFAQCREPTRDRVETAKRLVFVGRMVYDKGPDVLLKALVVLRDFGIHNECIFVGDGPARGSLERAAEDAGLDSVRFVGSLDGERVRDVLQSSDVGVVCSRWEEPFGIVALEMLACGLELVVSDVGGLRYASGGLAAYYDRGDPQALANALRGVIAGRAVSEPSRMDYLESRQPESVASEYLQLLSRDPQ